MPGTVPTDASRVASARIERPVTAPPCANCLSTAAVSILHRRTTPSTPALTSCPATAGISVSETTAWVLPLSSFSGMTTGGAMPSTGAGGSGRLQTRMTKSDSALASCAPPETSAKEWISPVRINSPAGVPSAVFQARREPSREEEKIVAPSRENSTSVTAALWALIVRTTVPFDLSERMSRPSVKPVTVSVSIAVESIAVAAAVSASSSRRAGGIFFQSLMVRNEPDATRSPDGAIAKDATGSRCDVSATGMSAATIDGSIRVARSSAEEVL